MVVRVYQKEINLNGRSLEELQEEMATAVMVGVELNYENRSSHVFVRVEADDEENAALHKLITDGFTEVEQPDS
jgi:hypothetical protein